MSLDDAYANGPYIKGAKHYPDRWLTKATDWASAQRDAGRAHLDLAYGDGKRERFDIFLPEGEAEGLMVFVHGGYWMKFDKSSWSHLARGATARGWAVAIPSYDLCPEVRIRDITRQVASAINTAAGLVRGPLVLTGHSAGGHLVARMLQPGLLQDSLSLRLRKVVPISPLADLRPLMQTSMNETLRLDAEEAEAESPALMEERYDVPVTVWVGGEERPVFLDQARWLAAAFNCERFVDEGRHHFDVIDALEEPDSNLTRGLLSARERVSL